MNPEIIYIDPDNFKRDLASATMRGLLDKGYTIGPLFPIQREKSGPTEIALLMCPPPAGVAVPAVLAESVPGIPSRSVIFAFWAVSNVIFLGVIAAIWLTRS